MPLLRDLGSAAKATGRGTRTVARGVRRTAAGTSRASRWVGRNVNIARRRGGVGNVGMMRLLDLHAVSCAGDTLITIGLAGTIFFAAPAGEARGRVALYLLITMVPFALLAPVVGPVLDRFRHGRRYALAATMLGRAFLAWVIADNLLGFGLYPAAFGVLALSRAYGVARSAAVPRLLPPNLGLSQAGARASVYGTVAGTLVAPLGVAAFTFGPQWPLRVASIIFLIGVVVALNLPPKADSDPPETVPKLFQVPWRHTGDNGDKVLSGRLVVGAVVGSTILRALYGFLLLMLAFAIREQPLAGGVLGIELGSVGQIGLLGAALVLGTFLSTAIGTGLRIRRPLLLQAVGFCAVALAGVIAAVRFTLVSVLLFCLITAIASGLAKLAVDASIQERIPDTVRASAFAHAETLLMLAFVAGGALGLIPIVDGRFGIVLAALAMIAGSVRAVVIAWRHRREVLHGKAAPPAPATTAPGPPPTTTPVPAQPVPVPAGTIDGDVAPPGYHIFRPSPPDSGVDDPRTGS